MGLSNELVTSILKNKPKIKRTIGVVADIISDTDSAKIKFNKNNKSIIMINKTNDVLSVGDHVWVYYWNTLSDGYVALKVGLSDFRFFHGYYSRPINTTTFATDAYLPKAKSRTDFTISYEYKTQETGNAIYANYPTVGAVSITYGSDGVNTIIEYHSSIMMYNGNVAAIDWIDINYSTNFTVYNDLIMSIVTGNVIKNVRYVIESENNQVVLVRYLDNVRTICRVLANDTLISNYGFFIMGNEAGAGATYNPGLGVCELHCYPYPCREVDGLWHPFTNGYIDGYNIASNINQMGMQTKLFNITIVEHNS